MFRRLLGVAAAVAVGAAAIPAQTTAAVLPYGASCRDFNNTIVAPVMTVSGLPQLGAPIRLNYLGPSGITATTERSIPLLITGTTSTAIPVPRLTPQMATNCYVWTTPDIAVFFMPESGSTGQYQTTLSYTIPNTPAMIGAIIYHQWATMVFNTLQWNNWVLKYMLFSNGVGIRAGV